MTSSERLRERVDRDIVEAVRDLEDIEDYLQRHDHELADNLSDVRIRMNRALMNEAFENHE